MRKDLKDLINGESPRMILWIYPITSLIILIGLPYLLTRQSIFDSFAFNNTGQIGDTIGGVTGPVIALIVGFLTFLAFWVQFQSNKAQTSQFKKQDTDNKIDRFENKFYELLRLHRDNVAEMSLGKSRKGRRVFLSMYDELKFCYYGVKIVYEAQKELKALEDNYKEEDLLNISYVLFFLGVGETSYKMTQDLLKKYNQEFIRLCNDSILDIGLKNFKSDGGSTKIFVAKTSEGREINFPLILSYKPFEGHVSRLGHYYRHLFQTVKYVVEQPDDLIQNKYEYLQTLRAQLSNHEQLLLYYNSFTTMGEPWIKNKYFTDYRFIRNIPLPLADIGIQPKERLGEKNSKGEIIFEWDEIRRTHEGN